MLTIGDKFKTLNEYQNDAIKSARQVVELQTTDNRQSQTIGSLQTNLTAVNNAVTTINLTSVTDLQDAINNLHEG